ncbi:MAG: hypothetical protein HY238_07010 [Acidobacteria bacterium]|nr:hypothetical protein [Acidobacteriota bacterium]
MDRLRQTLLSVVAAAILIAVLSVAPVARVAAQQTIRDQEYPARNAVQAYALGSFVIGAFGTGLVTLYTVPPMKRLVIENVSLSATIGVGQNMFLAALKTTAPGAAGPLDHYLVLSPQGTQAGGNAVFASNALERLYADPGTTVRFEALRTSGDGTGFVGVSISGYLVDLP